MSIFYFMRKRIELTGERFGRLTVIEVVGFINHHLRWKCICDCGKETEVSSQGLREGKSLSCGCYRLERIKEANSTQGGNSRNENKATYYAWVAMIDRCHNEKHKSYPDYGGRGVIVCDRWRGENGFANFFEDMGRKPSPELSLDRYPNNDTGIYELTNCQWRTRKQQQRNRRNNVWYEHDGRKMVAEDWCKELGVSTGCLRKRMKHTGKTFTEIYHEIRPSNNLKKNMVLKIFNTDGTPKEISEKFKVSASIVRDIKRGYTWSNITGKMYIPE